MTLNSEWRKSSRCGDLHCVEVSRRDDGTVAVRDSKSPTVSLVYTPQEWASFLEGVRLGEFDL